MSERSDVPSVLIVEDERDLADLYAEALSSAYAVEAVYAGADAIDALEPDTDVVLLDRRLSGMAGDDVLEQIKLENGDVRVAMVTAIDPDFDIIDLGIDDYLVKPVDPAELRDRVDKLLEMDDLEAARKELSSKRVKRNVLEVEKSPAELAESEEFQRLEARIDRLESEIGTLEADLAEESGVDQRVGD